MSPPTARPASPSPPGSGRGTGLTARRLRATPPEPIEPGELRGWVPIRLRGEGGRLRLEWIDAGDLELSEPFFYQTVRRLRQRLSYDVVVTGMEVLERLQEAHPGLAPNGFLFHVSHCGSTAVRNLLGALASTISLSEPRPLAEVLAVPETSEEQRIRWFRDMVGAYGQRRKGTETRYFLKHKSWTLLHFELVRKAFPETPWICLVRHPLEVLVGQFQRPRINTYWFQPPCPPGFAGEGRLRMGVAEAAARTLGRYYEIVHQALHSEPGGLCLDYQDLFFGEGRRRLLDHFGVVPTERELGRVSEALRTHSKDESRTARYEDDSARKRASAPPVVRDMVERWALEPYRELRELTARDARGADPSRARP